MLNTVCKKRKVILLITILIILLFIIFFIKSNYKNLNSGNNMTNKSIEEIEEYILNISSYEAKVSVTVESNKNLNTYILNQEYIKPNKFRQIILEPSTIEGLEIKFNGKDLIINNSKLNLNKIYRDYEYFTDDFLSLESFISDYKKERDKAKLYEKDNEIVFEIKVEKNKYIYTKKLHINKKTGNPTKIIIEDVNQKKIIYILYNEIKIKY